MSAMITNVVETPSAIRRHTSISSNNLVKHFFFSCDSFFIILNLSELKLFFIFSMLSRYLNCNIVSVLNSFFLLAALRVTTTAAPVVSTTHSLHTSKYIYAQNSVKEVKLNSGFPCFHASGHIGDFSKKRYDILLEQNL